MRVFKKTKSARRWTIEISDHHGIPRRFSGLPDKALTESLARNIRRLVGFRMAHELPDPALRQFLESAPSALRERLAKLGIIAASAVGKPLAEHLEDWKQSLLDTGATESYARLSYNRVKAVLDGTNATRFSDIDANKVAAYLAQQRQRGLSVASTNHYTRRVKQFCRWFVKTGLASRNPVECLRLMNADVDRRHERRAFDAEELRWLIDVTRTGGNHSCMTGRARALLYRLGASTGLRSSELRSLTRSSFNLGTDAPTVVVESAYTKNGRRAEIPPRPGMAADLRDFLATKTPDAPAFSMPSNPTSSACSGVTWRKPAKCGLQPPRMPVTATKWSKATS